MHDCLALFLRVRKHSSRTLQKHGFLRPTLSALVFVVDQLRTSLIRGKCKAYLDFHWLKISARANENCRICSGRRVSLLPLAPRTSSDTIGYLTNERYWKRFRRGKETSLGIYMFTVIKFPLLITLMYTNHRIVAQMKCNNLDFIEEAMNVCCKLISRVKLSRSSVNECPIYIRWCSLLALGDRWALTTAHYSHRWGRHSGTRLGRLLWSIHRVSSWWIFLPFLCS